MMNIHDLTIVILNSAGARPFKVLDSLTPPPPPPPPHKKKSLGPTKKTGIPNNCIF